MIQIFYNQSSFPFSIKKWSFYYQQMPEDIKRRIQRYRKEENKYQLLIGRLLLKEGMSVLGYSHFQLADVHYNDYNCPLWEEGTNFNIAHSGVVIACGFSKKEQIGVDVEQVREIDLKDFDYILNDLDYQNIEKAKNVFQAFFKIWTIKEAVTKAIGKGLAIDVQQIYIYETYAVLEEQKWYYQALNIKEGYAGHIVTDIKETVIELVEVQFKN